MCTTASRQEGAADCRLLSLSQGIPGAAGLAGSYDIVVSGVVQPAPVPPKRDLVALPPPPKVSLHAEGRFTVLSYNILADLYATVSIDPPISIPLCPWTGDLYTLQPQQHVQTHLCETLSRPIIHARQPNKGWAPLADALHPV